MESSLHTQVFFIRFYLSLTSLAPEVINCNFLFLAEMFFIDFFMRYMKMKMTPSCLSLQAGSDHVLFDLERSISKSYLRSGEVKVRSWPKYVNMLILRRGLTNQVVWHHLRVSISTLLRVIGEERIVTSCDLSWPQLSELVAWRARSNQEGAKDRRGRWIARRAASSQWGVDHLEGPQLSWWSPSDQGGADWSWDN